MSRDPYKLRVFGAADALAVAVYRATRGFRAEERFGLQAQLRRAAVSVPTNIVEGSARRTEREYVHSLHVAHASASEVRYLLGLSSRLGFLDQRAASELVDDADLIVRSLQRLFAGLGPKPEAGSRKPEA